MRIRGISFKNFKGIEISRNESLILERVGRIIMTFPGERVNNPEFGSLLEMYLFQRDNVLEQHVKTELKSKIEKYEPRVSVINSEVTYKDNVATVNIKLLLKAELKELDFETQIAV